MERETTINVLIISIAITILTLGWVGQYYTTQREYIKNGYTRATLQGDDYSQWVRETQ